MWLGEQRSWMRMLSGQRRPVSEIKVKVEVAGQDQRTATLSTRNIRGGAALTLGLGPGAPAPTRCSLRRICVSIDGRRVGRIGVACILRWRVVSVSVPLPRCDCCSSTSSPREVSVKAFDGRRRRRPRRRRTRASSRQCWTESSRRLAMKRPRRRGRAGAAPAVPDRECWHLLDKARGCAGSGRKQRAVEVGTSRPVHSHFAQRERACPTLSLSRELIVLCPCLSFYCRVRAR